MNQAGVCSLFSRLCENEAPEPQRWIWSVDFSPRVWAEPHRRRAIENLSQGSRHPFDDSTAYLFGIRLLLHLGQNPASFASPAVVAPALAERRIMQVLQGAIEQGRCLGSVASGDEMFG